MTAQLVVIGCRPGWTAPRSLPRSSRAGRPGRRCTCWSAKHAVFGRGRRRLSISAMLGRGCGGPVLLGQPISARSRRIVGRDAGLRASVAAVGQPGAGCATRCRSICICRKHGAGHARCVIVRLLGGLDYWRYGAEEFAASLPPPWSIPLALLPGDARRRSGGWSRCPAFRRKPVHGPPGRLLSPWRTAQTWQSAILALARVIWPGAGPDDGGQSRCRCPPHGIHSVDKRGGRAVRAPSVLFYRSHLAGRRYRADRGAGGRRCEARGLAVGSCCMPPALKAPACGRASSPATLRGHGAPPSC